MLDTTTLLSRLRSHQISEDKGRSFVVAIPSTTYCGAVRRFVPRVSVVEDGTDQEDSLAKEWMRIFSFLGRGPISNLTHGAIRQSMMALSPTHHSSHRISIRNYNQVHEVLRGTDFEPLLRD